MEEQKRCTPCSRCLNLAVRAIELFLQVAAAVQMDKLLLHLIIQKNGDGREELYSAMIDRLQCRNVPGGPCRPAADRCVAARVMRWPWAPGEREREREEKLGRPAQCRFLCQVGA